MKIALLCLTHQPSSILAKFLDQINKNSSFIPFIHHDFSQSTLPPEILNNNSIVILKEYFKTEWSHISLVKATIELLREAIKNLEVQWFALLSGSCYPALPLQSLENFLGSTKYYGFIEHTLLNLNTNWLHRAYHKHVFTQKIGSIPFISRKGKFYLREVRIQRPKTPFSKSFPLYFGSQWWTLHRDIVDEVVNHVKLPELVDFAESKQVHASDEWLIQSIVGDIMSGRDSEDFQIISKNLHYINWDNCQDWHPNILDHTHWDHILRSKAFFARKLDIIKSATLLNLVENNNSSSHEK
jgi:hypothetical protein